MNKVKGSIQSVEQEEMEDLIGNKIYACDVCGQIVVGDKGENMEETDCVECGNREWKLMGRIAPVEEDEFDENGDPVDYMEDDWDEGESDKAEEEFSSGLEDDIDTDKMMEDILDDEDEYR